MNKCDQLLGPKLTLRGASWTHLPFGDRRLQRGSRSVMVQPVVGDSAWLECAVGVVDTAEAAGSTAIHFGSWNLHLQCGRRPHGASQASKEAPQRSSPPWCANGTGILSHARGWGAWVMLLRGWRRPQPSSRGCTVAHSGLMHMFDPECVVYVYHTLNVSMAYRALW